MTLPRLHVVTDDDVLSDPGFDDRAMALIRAHRSAVALHLRAPETPVRGLLERAERLGSAARDAGTLLVVNDRVDVALATGIPAVQLGRRSIPVQAARGLLGDAAVIGCSVHGAGEAASASENGADFVLIGTIWETPSHPEEPGAGLPLVREAVADSSAPVLAIGGVTPERARRAVAAGAWGVALIRGVWHAEDPAVAAAEYLNAMGTGS
ncbi:MAG: thiamine phosphate synthase [Longimicrobiales bacterium]|nr:thiamine phosphate synthase [Longimicrobiales bacterium]